MKENVIQKKSFDFAIEIVRLYQTLVRKGEFVLGKQLLRSGTSIGANAEEADAAQSKRDFLSKMSIASKEARETRYWLRLLSATRYAGLDYSVYLAKIEELIRILTSIVKTTRGRIE